MSRCPSTLRRFTAVATAVGLAGAILPGASMPATGGGLIQVALLLFGLAGLGASALRRGPRVSS